MKMKLTSWKHNKDGVLESGDGQFSQQRVAGQSSKS
jgi:hypothetical protein